MSNWKKALKDKKLESRLMMVSGALYLVSFALNRRPYELLSAAYGFAAGALLLKESREQAELEAAG